MKTALVTVGVILIVLGIFGLFGGVFFRMIRLGTIDASNDFYSNKLRMERLSFAVGISALCVGVIILTVGIIIKT